MTLLSRELATLAYRDELQRDLDRATVCRFVIAYISDEGINSIGRAQLLAALRDPRSFGVSSLTCQFGFYPLFGLQASLGDSNVRLKYFMDPMIDERGLNEDLVLLHSKLVFLAMEKERKAVAYIGSHNWTRRALGPHGSRNAEATFRIEMDFDPRDLEGAGAGLASDVNAHLLSAYRLPVCLPATSENRPRFEQWYQEGCRNAPPSGLEKNTVLLAVRKDDGSMVTTAQWEALKNRSVYLQALEESEGRKLYDNTAQVVVLVWMSEADLRAGNQPVILICRGSAQNAGPQSQQAGTNQARDPIVGFDAVIFDERQLNALANGETAERRTVTIWSQQPIEIYDFEFPTSRNNSSQVDGGVRPNYQYHLEVEYIVFPVDGDRPDQPGMVWQRESFAIANKKTDAHVERMHGYLVPPDLEMAIKDCLERELSLNLTTATVLPTSSVDNTKLGKRLSRHPLHDAFIDPQAKLKPETFYEKAPFGTLVPDVDNPAHEDSGRLVWEPIEPVERVLRVFTMPLNELEGLWRETARAHGKPPEKP